MTVKEIFDTMDYGPAPESAGDALAWIVDQGSRFGMYINGDWTAARGEFHSRNPANGETLADLGTIYLMVLGLVAIVVMLKAPQGVWGFIRHRFDLQLFPLGYRVERSKDS